jgi:hypothetical protein
VSVFISDFKVAAGVWQAVHDDAPGGSHSGTISPTDVVFGKNMDGTDNHRAVIVECPVCGASSTHPVGGGAQPGPVQELFVRLVKAHGCACPGGLAANRPFAVIQSHVRAHSDGMDGAGRFQIQGTLT